MMFEYTIFGVIIALETSVLSRDQDISVQVKDLSMETASKWGNSQFH